MFPSKIASLYAIVEKPKRGRPRKTEKTKTVPRGTRQAGSEISA